jgi:aspartyl-tRNA(Asn)/glutamyl-tRNA(Gln) amidotransferase subunit B
LPALAIDDAAIAAAKLAIPELPERRTERLMTRYGLSRYDAVLLAASSPLADYFERTAALVEPKIAANWITRELFRTMNEHAIDICAVSVSPAALAELIRLVEGGEISGTTGRTVFDLMYDSGRSAAEIVKEGGLSQIGDRRELEAIVRDTLAANQKAVEEYRSGKTKAFGFLVGQTIKQTRGRADAVLVNELVKKALE